MTASTGSTGFSVVITTLIWKREAVFRLWARQVLRIIEAKSPEFSVKVVVCGSEGDKSRLLAHKYGFTYVEAPNRPLSRKANIRLQRIAGMKPDYVLFLGSDDLMSVSVWKNYEKWMKEGYEEISSMDLYLYDAHRDQAAYSTGYEGTARHGEPMAVGRCLHRSVLEKLEWMLWDDNKIGAMDGQSRRIYELNHKRKHYLHRNEGTIIVDIKTVDNIWPFEYITGRRSKCDREFIKREFELHDARFS